MSWKIIRTKLDPQQLNVEESLFSLANGYLGVRGNFEEGYDHGVDTIKGAYINAFYEIVDIPYNEKHHGFPSIKEKIVNVIDAQGLEIYLGEEEERFSLFAGEIQSYERILHLDKGYSERKIHWRSPKGKEVQITFRRLVSFTQRELFSIQVTLEPVNFFGKVKIVSAVDGNVSNYTNENDPRLARDDGHILSVTDVKVDGSHAVVVAETKRSQLQTACITTHAHSDGTISQVAQDKAVQTEITFQLAKVQTVEKRNVYVDSRRHGEDLVQQGMAIHQSLTGKSFSDLLQEQETYMQNYWSHADVVIHGDEKVQEGIRFNLFHLLQSAGRDACSNIAAKGISGEGYEGHYFWDTEIYMLPVFMLTKPELARQLLTYRYNILDHARARAKEMGHKQGALFPWRTITGQECSSYYPASTAQYHISADIAYAFVQYYLVSRDLEFFRDYAAEVLFETARLWIDTGHFLNDEFRIDAVTGPDEYTALVNNNYYTNAMAKYNLEWAKKAYDLLQKQYPDKLVELRKRINLQDEEPEIWQRAAKAMYLPYDEKLDINPQDDSFLQKAVWDFENTPKDRYPLLLNTHPLTLYRYQVCKQPDTVLAHFLLDGIEDLKTVKNSYLYYEKITTFDSSLSSCIFSIMGAKIGDMDRAYRYFMETARLDLDNTQKNTKDGLHLANMGGTWLAIIYGFAGLRIRESGQLSLYPQLPENWEGYECLFQYQGRDVKLQVDKNTITVSVTGEPLEIEIFNKGYTIKEQISINSKNW